MIMTIPSLATPYLLIQRVRLGLRTDVIERASVLLDSPWEILQGRAEALFRTRFELGQSDPFEWLATQRPQTREGFANTMADLSLTQKYRMEKRRTSGSTGTPLRFFRSKEMSAWMEATSVALYGWYGQGPWNRQARFWGAALGFIPRIKQNIKDYILSRRRFNAFSVSEQSCRRHFHRLRAFKPRHVYGYPSLIGEFAAWCSTMGLDGRELGVSVVFATGEPLHPKLRKRIREYFDCRVVNEYGCTEAGVLAFECEEGHLHLTPLAVWIEVLPMSPGLTGGGDRQDGELQGEILLTDLFGSASGLVRYRLGDVVVLHSQQQCPCGRQLPMVSVIAGRQNSFIRKPNGEKVYNAILSTLAPREVTRLRGAQTSPTDLEILVELTPGVTQTEIIKDYQESLEAALGPDMKIEVEKRDRIPRDSSGKLRYFVPLEEQFIDDGSG
jgi:phenylacetate-CoA ligase